jgi:hypothetical protein
MIGCRRPDLQESSPLRRELLDFYGDGSDGLGRHCYRASQRLKLPDMKLLIWPKPSVSHITAFYEVCIHEVVQVRCEV